MKFKIKNNKHSGSSESWMIYREVFSFLIKLTSMLKNLLLFPPISYGSQKMGKINQNLSATEKEDSQIGVIFSKRDTPSKPIEINSQNTSNKVINRTYLD